MRKFLFASYILLIAAKTTAQCPFAVTLVPTHGNCLGTSLTVTSPSNLATIDWHNATNIVHQVKAIPTMGVGVTIAGQYGRGSAANQLNNPAAVAVDADGNVYIVDRLNYRVQEWMPNATTGITVAGGNGQGTATNQLSDPIGIFVDKNKNIYIADFSNNRVQEWLAGAASGITVAGGNGIGAAANQLYNPTGVFVDVNGNVFVADAGNNRIQKWAPGATSGITVAGGNGAGKAANQFDFPSGVFVDQNGNIFISDEINNRVQKWIPGATSGITVAGGNGAGPAPNQLNTPYNIFVDANGNIYVDDLVNARIQEWTPGASNGVTVAGGNGAGSADNQFAEPICVYVDSRGVIYIADYGNNRVQKWAPQSLINTTYTPTVPGAYYATVTNVDGCTQNTNTIVVTGSVTPAISIKQIQTNICPGSSVSFVASTVNGGNSPQLQWKVNALNVGDNDSSFNSNNFNNGDLITCELTSNATCAIPSTVISDTIVINIGTAVTPKVNITASKISVCSGDSVVFNAIATNGGSAPAYQWQVNGSDVGANSNFFTSTSLKNNDVVSCTITSDAGCVTNINAVSNSISMHVVNAVISSLNISASTTEICSGDTIIFKAAANNPGNLPSYKWLVNGGKFITGSDVFITNALHDSDIVSCILYPGFMCALPVVSSDSIVVAVKPKPEIYIGNDTVIAPGGSVYLQPMISGNINSYLWAPQSGIADPYSSNTIASPVSTTTYTLRAISENGCENSDSIRVDVYYGLLMPDAFSPNNDGKNDVFRIPPSTTQKIKRFAVFNRLGEKVFETNNPGAGWNGVYNGNVQPQGAYVWIVEYENLLTGKPELAKGTVVLIR
ncbi:MAG: gliding motility-associated C-terminal domain-containing protein [Bacteroidetes bacterium]|nr:gliding motility-associated C-terminal domain-containing protein [Bacteroidota bacterium]